MRLEGIISEAVDIADSKIFDVIDKNLKLTDKKGGPVRVVVSGRNNLAVSLGDFGDSDMSRVQATFITGNKWKMKDSRGVAKQNKRTISDQDMVKAIAAIFAEAKKR